MKITPKTTLASASSLFLFLFVFAIQAGAQEYRDHTAVLGIAETITDPASGEPGQVFIFRQDVGNGQLSHDFVYADPRRASFNGGHAGVRFAVNQGFMTADVNAINQSFWLYDSIGIWDTEACTNMMIEENPVPSGQVGVVENFFNGLGIIPNWVADITQVGFRSSSQFLYFGLPGNEGVLGVTFTLFWTDAEGNLTDIDNNGKIDVAFREIYYNDDFEWADNGVEGPQPSGPRVFDFPTVAIHEVGHGVSAAHFGLIGVQDGFLVAHPRSIMNAIYGGTLRGLHGRDQGSNCSNWAQWPNR